MIESERDRTITGILIPFVPCSARIAVIFALASAFTGPVWAIVIFLFVILIISLSGKTMTYFLKKPMGLILDIPSLKLPSLKISFRKTWFRTKEFFREAIVFLMAGSIVLGWIEYFKVGSYINVLFSPILKSVLGLPEELGSTLVFGFLRKELIIVMASQAMGVQNLTQLPLTVDQVIVFLIFVTLYFPCFTTFVVLCKEFSWKIGIYSAIFSLIIATVSALIFKIILAL
jgi:ferrous iron transport protein B